MLKIEDIMKTEVKTSNIGENNSLFYSPYAAKAKSAVYKATLRFLINPREPENSIISKYCYFLRNEDGEGKYYDSATTINEKCQIHEIAQKLRNGTKQDVALANKKLNRSAKHYALVQIIEDTNEPSVEGTIQIFGFGQIIMNMIKNAGGASEVFHYLQGKEFKLEISKKNGNNNFRASKFIAEARPVVVNGKTFEANTEGFKMLNKYFETIPKLEVCKYKSWDEETETEVIERLKAFRKPEEVDAIQDSKQEDLVQSAASQKTEELQEQEDNIDDFLDNLDL